MKFSYDYEELLEELQSDVAEGLLTLDDPIYIVRGEIEFGHYFPIVDYYYNIAEVEELAEMKKVKDVLAEMERWDSIFPE